MNTILPKVSFFRWNRFITYKTKLKCKIKHFQRFLLTGNTEKMGRSLFPNGGISAEAFETSEGDA